MLRSVTPGFEFFLPVMRELFIKDYGKIKDYVRELSKNDNKKISNTVYGMSIVTKYKKLLSEIEGIYNEYTKYYGDVIIYVRQAPEKARNLFTTDLAD